MNHMEPYRSSFKKIIAKARESILNFDSREAESAVREALDAGIDPVDLVELGFIEGMKEMGDRYEKGDADLLHVLAASKIMEKGLIMLNMCSSANKKDIKVFGNIVMCS
ncbi:MAG: B12-binding domain-containing protein [Methanolobus sp.]|nr:B12-binding domain-containing protein [Methanolobus sp.]